MTSVTRGTETVDAPPPAAALRRVRRSVVFLYVRLVRRSTVILAVGVAMYVAIEALSYIKTYPNEAQRDQLAAFSDEPAVRMLQGIPHAVNTVGGFVVWDGGYLMAIAVAIWAVMTTSRVLRGEEDSDRFDLIAAGPVSASRTTLIATSVVAGGCVAVGFLAGLAILAFTGDPYGSVLFGLGLAFCGIAFVAATAVVAQLFGVRRRVAGISATLVGAAFLVRMVANSTDDRVWLGWFTPFGWMDRLQPFGQNNLAALLVYAGVPIALFWLTMILRGQRDTGSAIIPERAEPRSRMRWLGSPIAFAWRSTRGVWLAWVLGLGGYALMIGTLIQTIAEYLEKDPNYRKTMDDLGMSAANSAQGMVGLMGIVMGLVICLYVAWRIGVPRQEEETERLEHLLTRPLPRWRWLAGHVLLATLCATALAVTTGAMVWAGAAPTAAPVTLGDGVASVTNLLPVVALTGGLAIAVFGVWPRFTVAVPVGFVVVTYILQIVGPAFKWPEWVLWISPFNHVAYVPAQSFEVLPAVVMTCLGAALAAVGLLTFQRRDLVGA